MSHKAGIFLFFLIPFVMVSFYARKFSHYAQRPRTKMDACKVIRILCFGDSLTTGYVNPKTFEISPYSTKLQEYFDLHNRTVLDSSIRPVFEVRNAGSIPGGCAKDQMLQRLNRILQRSRVKYNWVIILGGTNDLNSVKPGKGSLSHDSKSIFNAIVKLHNITHDYGARSVAVSIPDRECEGLGTCENLRETHKEINQLLREFTVHTKANVVLADLARVVYLPRDRRLWSDPLHFTEQGYKKMAEIIYKAMREHV